MGLGFSANANERNTCFIAFNAPGAGTGPFQGKAGYAINPLGDIVGQYIAPGRMASTRKARLRELLL